MTYLISSDLDFLNINNKEEFSKRMQFITPKELSLKLGVSQPLLCKWRRLGIGPPYIQPVKGGSVKYDRFQIDDWIEMQKQNNLGLFSLELPTMEGQELENNG